MVTFFAIAQIVVYIAVIVILIFQAKGSGGLGGIFGQSDGVYRTKRGTEKLLFNLTIILIVILIILSIVMLKIS